LLLLSEAGTAGAIAQAIDASTMDEQEGTLAGDDTVLVLFADEARLQAWLARFEGLRPGVTLMGKAR
jgi:arginine repressor